MKETLKVAATVMAVVAAAVCIGVLADALKHKGFTQVRPGQVWRTGEDDPWGKSLHIDYRVLAVSNGWVLYQYVDSGVEGSGPLRSFKAGAHLTKEGEQ